MRLAKEVAAFEVRTDHDFDISKSQHSAGGARRGFGAIPGQVARPGCDALRLYDSVVSAQVETAVRTAVENEAGHELAKAQLQSRHAGEAE